jgi:hypothetical protein
LNIDPGALGGDEVLKLFGAGLGRLADASKG